MGYKITVGVEKKIDSGTKKQEQKQRNFLKWQTINRH